jgi:hypothetical protein
MVRNPLKKAPVQPADIPLQGRHAPRGIRRLYEDATGDIVGRYQTSPGPFYKCFSCHATGRSRPSRCLAHSRRAPQAPGSGSGRAFSGRQVARLRLEPRRTGRHLDHGHGYPPRANLTQHPAGDFRPAWSPDSQWIALTTDRLTIAILLVDWDGRVSCLDGYSSRSASTGATLDARSAGSSDAASAVARRMAAPNSSARGSPGAMP